jgi:seryl-tRNA synthetase
MKLKKLPDLKSLPDYRWIPNGQSNLSGDLLKLYQSLDTLFLSWATRVSAKDHQFPVFIQARELQRLDYFRSFPHLISFPVYLSRNDENLRRFTEGKRVDEEGAVQLTDIAPIHDCLTPAACYHFYIHYQGQALKAPLYLTTRANCFRREDHYLPLQRQWNFGMREIICIGTAEEVKPFLENYREFLTETFQKLGLPVKWDVATDPFFDPTQSPKHLMQQLDPVKYEMIYDGELSIGSTNYHRNYFGEAFQITRDGEDAFSGCVAFGLERWVFAILNEYGADPKNWPKEIVGGFRHDPKE